MPDPELSQVFREVCAAEWGIRPAQALEALRRPDQVELLEEKTATTELRLRIVAKRKVLDERPDKYRGMLRLYREENPPSLVITLGFGVGVNRYKDYLRGKVR